MDAEADAVMESLCGQIQCECGLTIELTKAYHGGYVSHAYCDCGVKYRQFKSRGWVVGKRTLRAWKAREKALLAQIFSLEGQLGRH